MNVLKELDEFEERTNDRLQRIIETTKTFPRGVEFSEDKDKIFNTCMRIRMDLNFFVREMKSEMEPLILENKEIGKLRAKIKELKNELDKDPVYGPWA